MGIGNRPDKRRQVMILDIVGQLSLAGDLAAFRSRMETGADGDYKRVLFFLQHLSGILEDGIAELLNACARFKSKGIDVRICCAQPAVLAKLRAKAIDRLFPYFQVESDALQSFETPPPA